jgi:hypothetical protein
MLDRSETDPIPSIPVTESDALWGLGTDDCMNLCHSWEACEPQFGVADFIIAFAQSYPDVAGGKGRRSAS